jgi:hypothetical protein
MVEKHSIREEPNEHDKRGKDRIPGIERQKSKKDLWEEEVVSNIKMVGISSKMKILKTKVNLDIIECKHVL